MKQGYLAEINARKDELEQAKQQLEVLYMNPIHKDENMDSELKGKFNQCFSLVENYLATFTTTLKSVKMAIDSWIIDLMFDCYQCNSFPNEHLWDVCCKIKI